MSNRICKCGHSEDKHQPMHEYDNGLACFHRVGDEGDEIWYCPCMAFEEDVVVNMQNDLKAVEANYDALQSPMPCGHLARYAVNEKEGTQYCLMCHVSNLDGTIDVLHKTLHEIAMGLDEAEGCTCEMGEAPGGEQYHAISCSETLAIIARRAIGEA